MATDQFRLVWGENVQNQNTKKELPADFRPWKESFLRIQFGWSEPKS